MLHLASILSRWSISRKPLLLFPRAAITKFDQCLVCFGKTNNFTDLYIAKPLPAPLTARRLNVKTSVASQALSHKVPPSIHSICRRLNTASSAGADLIHGTVNVLLYKSKRADYSSWTFFGNHFQFLKNCIKMLLIIKGNDSMINDEF